MVKGPLLVGTGQGNKNRFPCVLEFLDPIKVLFGGGVPEEPVESFVNPVAGGGEGIPEVAEQIDPTQKDQFFDSPDLRDSVMDAALANEATVAKLTGATTGDDNTADQIIRVIGHIHVSLATRPQGRCGCRRREPMNRLALSQRGKRWGLSGVGTG